MSVHDDGEDARGAAVSVAGVSVGSRANLCRLVVPSDCNDCMSDYHQMCMCADQRVSSIGAFYHLARHLEVKARCIA